MQQQNIPISSLVDMYKRGELRLPEIQPQKVPLDEALWEIDRYRDFLAARRVALADCMNAFIRTKAGI